MSRITRMPFVKLSTPVRTWTTSSPLTSLPASLVNSTKTSGFSKPISKPDSILCWGWAGPPFFSLGVIHKRREQRCAMRVAKRTRLSVTLMLVVGAAALILGCKGARQQASGKAPPIPAAGPLARPKSLRQVGAPAEATRAIPPDNPQTPEKIALGQRLFFDGRLSADGTVACSTCHDPGRAFTDGRPASIGIKGRVGQRNAPTILNALYNKTQFWDGRVNTL